MTACPCGAALDDRASAAHGLCRRCDLNMQVGRPYGAKLRPAQGIRLERSIVRRDAKRPELAQGERTLIEMDPEQIKRMFDAGESFLAQLNRLLKRPQPRRRRRPR